ncbi:hypothetical protein [Zhongshania sp.]|jgi:hypothetical protein|uniref:hypothetical protein n=1 Tax=Zhongshania sp. TaxID=1971902 RepID=UPI001B4BC41D|nr:hypothetical protein [Zhongshania sp.]MBQ0796839.1 hypothetical protein [Zhongshania sp.]
MLKQLLKLPLSAKCGLITALICAIAGMTLLLTSMTASKQILLETTHLIGQQWTNQLASQSQQALLRNDKVSLQAILQDYINSPLIVYGSIANSREETVAETGHWRAENLNYEAPVAANGRLGLVKLSLSRELIGDEIRDLGKTLLILTGLLACFSYAIIAVPMRRIEGFLELARKRMAQPLRNDHSAYPGSDSLGKLLDEIHNPQIRLSKLGKTRYKDYYILHCHWQAFSALQTQMAPASFREHLRTSYARGEAIAKLYHADIVVHRHNAISLRFFEVEGTDHPLFRALCCADLFQSLDKVLRSRAGIAHIHGEGDHWECAAKECAAIDQMHTATAEGKGTWLDDGSRDNERLDAWVDIRGNHISAMKSPYSDLLERQQTQLKKLTLDAFKQDAARTQPEANHTS